MSIFGKTLTGDQIILKVGDDIKIGPWKENGTFLIRTSHGAAYVVEACQRFGSMSIAISPT